MQNQNDGLLVAKFIGWVILVIIVVGILFSSFGTIDSGERGVRVRLGNVIGIVEPGLYFKLPFLEKVRKIDVRTQTVIYERENPLASASADLQDVNIATVTNYHVDATKVMEVYTKYKTLEAFETSVIRPAVRDTVKAIASQYPAGDLITKRPEFAEKVAQKLNERLEDTYIVVEQSNITDIQFSQSFTQAIESKVTATQNAEAAKNNLEKVKFEAQQTIETAKAQAEAIKIQAQAINSQGGADYVELQKIKVWDGHSCTSYCGLDAMMITPTK